MNSERILLGTSGDAFATTPKLIKTVESASPGKRLLRLILGQRIDLAGPKLFPVGEVGGVRY